MILLGLKAFNFFTAYLPFILFDCSYISYKLIVIIKNNDIKDIFNILNSWFHKNGKILFKILLFMIILLLITGYTLLPVISESKSLLYKDPYFYLKNTYYVLDNQSISPDVINRYPPGFAVYFSSPLLIFKNYELAFYYIKFGGIHFTFLSMIAIFFIIYNLLRKLYIAFVCSILFLAFYLYIFGAIAFLSKSIATFYLCTSIFLFFEHKKHLYLTGFFLPIIFFFNPAVAFYCYLLLGTFIIGNIVLYERHNLFIELKSTIKLILIMSFLFLSYLFYLIFSGFDILKLINTYLWRITGNRFNIKYGVSEFNLNSQKSYFLNSSTTDLIKNIINFIIEPNLTISALTLIFILFFTSIGFLFNPFKKKKTNKNKIHFLCRLSFFFIIMTYTVMILFLPNNNFLRLFQDAIWSYYTPLLIILGGIGILTIEKNLKKLGIFLKGKIDSSEMTNSEKKIKRIKKMFRLKNLMIISLIFSAIFIQLKQKEIAKDWIYYEFNDQQIECFLYIRNELPQGSKIMISERLWALGYFVYDMETANLNLNNITSFEDLEIIIISNNFNYILLNRIHDDEVISEIMIATDPYEEKYRNEGYILFRV